MVQSVCLSVMEGQPLALHGAFPSLDIFLCSPAVQAARNTRCSEIQSSGVYAPSAADRAIHAFAHRTWTRELHHGHWGKEQPRRSQSRRGREFASPHRGETLMILEGLSP